jgi:hypothetical protein
MFRYPPLVPDPALPTNAVNLQYLQTNYALKNNSVLTGVPTAPTAAVGTNTTQLATTAYTVAEIASRAPSKTGGGASGSWGIDITGSSVNAATLTIPRNFSLAGVVTATAVGFNGSGNVELTTTIAANALSISQVSNLQNTLDGKIASTSIGAVSGVASLTSGSTLTPSQMPALTGDVTNTAGTLASTISNAAVTLVKMANLAANSIIGNNTGAAATPIALTAAQVTAMLPTYTTTVKGLVPPPAVSTSLSFLCDDGVWRVPVGGSAVPQGSSGQVQFNSAGAFGGAVNVQIENNNLRLADNTLTTASAANGLDLFSEKIGGKSCARTIDQFGQITTLQPHIGRNAFCSWMPVGNATTINLAGGAVALTAVGTATTANIATTNRHTWMRRVEWLVTVAATTAIAGFYRNVLQWGRGAAAGDGGFHLICRFGPATGVATTTSRSFTGMRAVTTAPTDVEPSTLTNIIGVGWGAADTNMQIFYNDATGTASVVDLGVNFPVPTVDRTKVYELAMFCPPNGTAVYVQVRDLGTGAVSTLSTLTTDLPASTQLLAPGGWQSVGGTSSVTGYALMNLYIDSDY